MSTDRDDALDTLIDDTARDLTARAPSPSLRENVRARLSPRRAWWQLPLWQPALGVAALAVVVILVMSRSDPAPVAPQSAPEQAAAPPTAEEPALAPRASARTPASPVEQPGVRALPKRAVARVPLAAFVTREDETMLEPLVVAPMPAPIAVVEELPDPTPLRIAGLEIRPLSAEE